MIILYLAGRAFLIEALAAVLFSILAVAQSPRTHQDAYALPNAPSASQPNIPDIHLNPQTTSENPRGRGLGKMAEGPLPDGANHPARNVIEVDQVKELRFWQPRPTFKAVFKSKSFWLSETPAWGAAIADARINNCNARSNAPCGKEMYLDALAPMLFVTPMHILTARGISPLFGLGACGLVIFRHTKGAVTGNYP